jgi:hypothetical protein
LLVAVAASCATKNLQAPARSLLRPHWYPTAGNAGLWLSVVVAPVEQEFLFVVAEVVLAD